MLKFKIEGEIGDSENMKPMSEFLGIAAGGGVEITEEDIENLNKMIEVKTYG